MPTAFESFSQTYDVFYKTTRTSRGLMYRYLCVPGSNKDLPTLLWLHGFPSSVYDWHYQICHGISLRCARVVALTAATTRPSTTSRFRCHVSVRLRSRLAHHERFPLSYIRPPFLVLVTSVRLFAYG